MQTRDPRNLIRFVPVEEAGPHASTPPRSRKAAFPFLEADASVKTQPRAIALVLLGSLLATACGDAGSSGVAPATSPSTPSPAPSGEAAASPSGPVAKVRLALDWTPNTNHTGFYVAQAKDWYAEAGQRIELEILPYGGTTPETIIAAGQAECGISFQDSMTFAVAAGAPITSVMAILQHTAQEIAVLESSPIARPKDLDGTVYAGFGYPNEVPTLKAVIQADGGTGDFDVVTLDTAAYEALYSKRADFVITFSAWEAIEAQQRDIGLRTFQFPDYGFPDFYQVVLACNRDWLEANPEVAKAFVAATVKGFQFAADNPEEAASILVAQNPGVFDANPGLPEASQLFLAQSGLLVDEAGRVGAQTLDTWTGYSSFLYEQGLLTDADGQPLTRAPDYSSLFTNDFLPVPGPG